ncbi:MAG: methylmalonyl Co-A mutase-associated GTPase MeaB [Roseiflexaceae bacterium]
MAMRRQLSTEMYVDGVRAGDRATLARAITLIESDAPHHRPQAQEVLSALLPASGQAMRIGITGVPGVGKSSFIETLGVRLGEAGQQIAVLAVDPSSSRTHGSILGDKTRMERLSRMPNAYIRPSPTGGALGGVARKTRESMIVCEAAGFTTILVETVGVGQSETTVRAMTDCFVLLALAGAGDELQAIKKGVVELADLVVLTKADGENRARAEAARADYLRALRYIAPATVGWQTQVLTCSAHTGDGIDRVWQSIEHFFAQGHTQGSIEARRRSQTEEWLQSLIAEELTRRFYSNPAIAARMPELRAAVAAGQLPVTRAVETLLSLI